MERSAIHLSLGSTPITVKMKLKPEKPKHQKKKISKVSFVLADHSGCRLTFREGGVGSILG